MSRASLLSFLWGVTTTIVVAPIAGFLAMLFFARTILADTRRLSGPQTLAAPPVPRRSLVVPVLIFAALLLLILWLLGYAWPSARQMPAYPAGAFSALLGLGALTWVRSRARRSSDAVFPARVHPGAIQRQFIQDLHEAVAQGRIPAGVHGELTVFLQTDAEGRLVELSIGDASTVPAPVRAIAERTLSGIRTAAPAASTTQFVLRY